MRIALFYPRNLLGCWFAVGGYVDVLERMGHEVTDFPFPGNVLANVDAVKGKMPKIEEISERYDCVLSAYHEYTQPWLNAVYGLDEWKKLRVPVIARFDESMDRADLALPQRIKGLLQWADFRSFPAAQDAERFGGSWVPFGSDTRFFCDDPIHPADKKYQVGFLGSLYQVRKTYLDGLNATIDTPDFVFTVGNAIVQDLSGVLEQESMRLLASNYCQIKIFFCLPPQSQLVVQKIFDVMACGGMVMYPRLWGNAVGNLSLFKEGEEIVYYDPGYFLKNVEQIREHLKDNRWQAIAEAGRERVLRDYTAEQMLEKVLQPVTAAER